MTEAEYWAAIDRIPLYRQRESSDGDAWICRDRNNQPVRVTKPEFFRSDDERHAALDYYRSMHGPAIN